MGRTKRKVTAALLASAVAGMLAAAPASADCLSAEVYFRQPSQSTNRYVVGPKKCVADTPWNESFGAGHERFVSNVGTVGAWVWIPAP